MNIDSDYLWDKTGEPDPEIQQLEEILGSLRYQPQPLKIPAGLQVGRERSFFRGFAPRLAVAATIAMLLLGLGLWLGLQRLQRSHPAEIVKTTDTPAVIANRAVEAPPKQDQNSNLAISSATDQKRINEPRRDRVNQSLLAGNTNRARREDRSERVKNQQLALKKLQEAEAAKDQLMLAFRVASAKLNFAQRKTQDLNQREPAHNQHKIG
jgi:hypothetical protein